MTIDDDEDLEIEIEPDAEVTHTYIPEDPEEWRRQWCLGFAGYMHGGQGHETILKAASAYEDYLIKGITIKLVKD